MPLPLFLDTLQNTPFCRSYVSNGKYIPLTALKRRGSKKTKQPKMLDLAKPMSRDVKKRRATVLGQTKVPSSPVCYLLQGLRVNARGEGEPKKKPKKQNSVSS